MHGPCNYYYPNGKAEKELKYNYGLLHGVCNYFNENGKLIKTQYYNSDVIIKEINY
jgi:antitoxin component YwqK of YwqJK toxin-antitoxin module